MESSRIANARRLNREVILIFCALILIVTGMVLLSGLSIEILSSVRAYVNGEGLWSKAEKESVLFLARYASSHSEGDFLRYREAMRVPLGDHNARVELSRPAFSRGVARQGFLEGRNHPDDVDRMIWLFRCCHAFTPLKKAIGIWEQADVYIAQLQALSDQLHAAIVSGDTAPADTTRLLSEIYQVNARLTPLEDSFSQTLGEAARNVQRLLWILLIAGGALLIVGGILTCSRLLARFQDADRKYRQLANTASDAILIVDAVSGAILECNQKAEEMLGAPASQLIGTPQPLLPVQDAPGEDWEKFVANLRRGAASSREMRLRRTNAAWISVEVSANLTWIGRRTIVQIIVRDVTERKRDQDALRLAHDKALDASRAKGQFLANMSHEIRTPMNGVLGMLGVLQTTNLDAEQREYAGIAKDAADSLLTVINDILDFSRIEAGRPELYWEYFDFRQAAMRAMEMLRPKAEQKGLDLVFEWDASLPSSLRGDATRLRQILSNLVSNAIKFTNRGSVTLSAGRRAGDGGQEWLCFEVRDTGIGIPAEAQARLFAAFSQADGSITRKYGGTGLGLAICKQIAELMGGRIGVRSEQGSGSTFWFELPLVTEAEGRAEPLAKPPLLEDSPTR